MPLEKIRKIGGGITPATLVRSQSAADFPNFFWWHINCSQLAGVIPSKLLDKKPDLLC